MKCACGEEVLFLIDGKCKYCQSASHGGSKNYKTGRKRHMIADNPIKGVGIHFGTVKVWRHPREASNELGITVSSINQNLRGASSGRYNGWKFDRISIEEYEIHMKVSKA